MASTSAETLGHRVILYTGPLFIGTVFNWAFFGIVLFQAYIYLSRNFHDALWIRGVVIGTLTIDTLQTIFATHFVWNEVITNWGDPTSLTSLPWSAYPLPVLSGIIAAIVQIFCAWRISRLSKSLFGRCVSVVVVLVAVMQCTATIVVGIQWQVLGVGRASQLKAPPTIWLGGSAICDIIIAVAMIYLLTSAKTSTMLPRTTTLIDKLIIKVVQTGAITAVVATVELILFLVAPLNYLHVTMLLFLGKLYSNVLLANLNSRRCPSSKIESSVATHTSNNVHIHTFRHVETDIEFKSIQAEPV